MSNPDLSFYKRKKRNKNTIYPYTIYP